jgi:nucleoside-diphosphate-sugar epimerase
MDRLRFLGQGLVALTGGTGFVGSHVAEGLLGEGYRVRALVRRPESPGWLAGLPVEFAVGDVRRAETLGPLVAGCSWVVHVAGKTSARSETEYMAANAEGAANLARVARARAPGAHFLLVSSQAAAGPSRNGEPVRSSDPPRPVSAYGRSKLAGEDAVRSAGTAFTILRPSAVYGPRETAIKGLFVAASRGIVPVLAGGTPRIQLVHATDVAAAVLGALARGGRNETFFVAHPEVLDYRQIAVILSRLRTPPARLVPVPGSLVRLAGFLAEAATAFASGPPVFNREKATELLQPAWVCDVSDAQAALGQPFRTSFSEGARSTWEWYRAQGWLG